MSLASAILVLASVAAGAGAGIDDYPKSLKSKPKDSIEDQWKFFNRECTSFVAWRLNSRNRVAFTNYYRGPRWSHAKYWDDVARSLKIPVNGTPAVGAVAQSDTASSLGHVAWVEAVNTDGTVTIEEYNFKKVGGYGERRVPRSSFRYIHIKDLPAPPVPGTTWYQRNYNSAGPSSTSFGYGLAGDKPVVGNWDGVGGDTIGVFRGGAWYLRNYNSAGPTTMSFGYGSSTDVPVVGDWDGDGDDTIGVFRAGVWYLRNSNSSGPSDAIFSYGRSTDKPVVGNWDGVGGDTVGVFRAGTWYQRNYNSAGPSSTSFSYGRSTDKPVVGNWDGVGGDTIGVFRAGTWYIRNYNSAGSSSASFSYGRSTDKPIVGDWDGYVGDTIGVFR